MSATIQARGVAAAFGDRELFSGLDLVVAPGDVVGLVGPNGAGKTTTVEILEGYRDRDAGDVRVLGIDPQGANRHWRNRVGIVLQSTTGLDLLTPREALRANAKFYSQTRDLDEVIHAVGLDEKADARIAGLSGGQAARVSLAGLDALEDFVLSLDAPLVLVSHDREFLSRTVTSVVEIDRSLQRVAVYGGSYDSYLEERSIARRQARESYEDYTARKAGLEERARRQRAWMDKGLSLIHI